MQSQVATAVIYALNNLYLNQQSRWFILNTISNVTLWTGCTDRRFSVDCGELCLCDTLNYLFSSFPSAVIILQHVLCTVPELRLSDSFLWRVMSNVMKAFGNQGTE